jgi:hypothetical protein
MNKGLLKNAHLFRYAYHSSLRRTKVRLTPHEIARLASEHF